MIGHRSVQNTSATPPDLERTVNWWGREIYKSAFQCWCLTASPTAMTVRRPQNPSNPRTHAKTAWRLCLWSLIRQTISKIHVNHDLTYLPGSGHVRTVRLDRSLAIGSRIIIQMSCLELPATTFWGYFCDSYILRSILFSHTVLLSNACIKKLTANVLRVSWSEGVAPRHMQTPGKDYFLRSWRR